MMVLLDQKSKIETWLQCNMEWSEVSGAANRTIWVDAGGAFYFGMTVKRPPIASPHPGSAPMRRGRIIDFPRRLSLGSAHGIPAVGKWQHQEPSAAANQPSALWLEPLSSPLRPVPHVPLHTRKNSSSLT